MTTFVISAEEHYPIVSDASTDTVKLLFKDEKAKIMVKLRVC